jgi:hypothetical protein
MVNRSGSAVVAAAPPSTATGAPGSVAATTSDPAGDATIVDAGSDGRFGTDGARFATPSRNIACMMTADEVRCDVAQRTWQTPPKPADCIGDFGNGASVTGPGPGRLTCAGDTVADPALTVLAYGQGVRFGGVVSVSRETGMRCTNEATGHGFRVARASYDLF